jgi:hypothetical protein
MISAFLALPFIMNAQSALDKTFTKYAGQDQFTTVNITREMFSQFSGMMGNSKDTSAQELKNIMDKLTGLKVITYSIDTADYSKAVSIYNEWTALFPVAVYKELMAVTEGRDNYRFLTKTDGDGKISEMVMLMKGKKELVVLSLCGTIDLSNISKISKGMGIHGMEGFQKIKDQHQSAQPKK